VKFPSGKWGNRHMVFHPAPVRPPFRPFAAMVFAWQDGHALICNIPGRGWCIPSGRVEPNEEGIAAAEREAYEEGGARLGDLRYMGCYQISDKSTTLWAEAYTASIEQLEEIPDFSESTERKLVDPEQLPDVYHMWDSLTQAVFEYSRTVFER
jgi:8-oxo-dGTP diphosphatase